MTTRLSIKLLCVFIWLACALLIAQTVFNPTQQPSPDSVMVAVLVPSTTGVTFTYMPLPGFKLIVDNEPPYLLPEIGYWVRQVVGWLSVACNIVSETCIDINGCKDSDACDGLAP